MMPYLSKRGVVEHYGLIASIIERHIGKWAALSGQQFNFADELSALTFEIASGCLFGAGANGVEHSVVRSIALVEEALAFVSALDFLPLIGETLLQRKMDRLSVISAPFQEFVSKVANGLSSSNAECGRALASVVLDKTGHLAVEEVGSILRDEVKTFLVAAADTSALALAFALYAMMKQPDVSRKLYQEVDEVCRGEFPRIEHLPNLRYTKMILEEAMRLFPPAPVLTYRQAQMADEVAGCFIPAGRTVVIMPWLIHRHRKNWTNPEVFDPERFSPEKRKLRGRFSYLPFGAGPRSCIGANLAIMEMVLILAALAQKFNFWLPPQPKIVLRHRITMRPRNGILMKLELR